MQLEIITVKEKFMTLVCSPSVDRVAIVQILQYQFGFGWVSGHFKYTRAASMVVCINPTEILCCVYLHP